MPANRGADADERLDALLQHTGDGGAVGRFMAGDQLAQHLHLVERALARHHPMPPAWGPHG